MSDNLPEILYGKTVKTKLADGKEYVLRELDYDSLQEVDWGGGDPNNTKAIKEIAWGLLRYDNPGLDKNKLGRLITFSMMKEGSDFMRAIKTIMGQDDPKEERTGEK